MQPTESIHETRKLSIVTAIFPQYDWVREILGNATDSFDLTLLMDNLIDLHNYQPTVEEIIKIGASDLFIHVGGHSDKWVNDVLRQATNSNTVVINLLDVLGDAVKPELIQEGMEHVCDDDCDEHDYYGEVHVHEDEHVWVSLRLTKVICAAIAEVLAELDPKNAEAYQRNLNEYIEELSVLDREYQMMVDAANNDTLIFADRFPFRYLMDDYGLSYYAAFSGCSAETEASFNTIVFLATKMEELQLNSIIVTESGNESIARTVINSTPRKNQEILILNAMQSVTREAIDNGITYLSIMENNLKVLREALR
jgi:zinc transport system substrate-binding protein